MHQGLGIQHLLRMTDDVAIAQHATHALPNRHEGYCLDDACRAALVLSRLIPVGYAGENWYEIQRAINSNLQFMLHALDPETNRFRNFKRYDRKWIDDKFHQDAHGRGVWVLGELMGDSFTEIPIHAVRMMFCNAVKPIREIESLRARAFCLLGLVASLDKEGGGYETLARELMDKHFRVYLEQKDSEWLWFENKLSYDNAILPRALIAAGSAFGDDDVLNAGLESLEWLMQVQTAEEGYFRPPGSNGFYVRGENPARFDQQPLEAWSSLEACVLAHKITGEQFWMDYALLAFSWFFGGNDLGCNVVDFETGGCFDGLTENGPNLNQGAESTISLLGSLTAIPTLSSASDARRKVEALVNR
jgi:hypothetical protein